MFGIGFFELVIIAVAILVVVGPKKLPEVMRQAGKFFVHIRRTTNDVRSTFDQVIREAEDEIRKKEIEELKNVLQSKPAGGVVETESRPADDVHANHGGAPEGTSKYNPYGGDYFKGDDARHQGDGHHDDGHHHHQGDGHRHHDHETHTAPETSGEKK